MRKRISALARLVILDGLRRHALIGLILFALAGIIGGLFFFDFIPRDIGRASNDFLFSIIWLTGFVFLLFHAVQIMSWDNERGVLHAYLARPISRTEYGLGLFAGLALLLLTLNCILGFMGWLLLNYIKGSVDAAYFQNLSLTFYLVALFGLYWIELTILAVILFISSVMRGSFPVLLLTLCYYFICTGLPVVRQSFQQKIIYGVNITLGPLLKGLTALFPDFSWLDFKTLAASGDAIPAWPQLLLPFALITLYMAIVLWMACMIYERRDLQ